MQLLQTQQSNAQTCSGAHVLVRLRRLENCRRITSGESTHSRLHFLMKASFLTWRQQGSLRRAEAFRQARRKLLLSFHFFSFLLYNFFSFL